MFEISTEYTYQDYLAFARLVMRTYQKGLSLVLRLLLGLAGGCYLAVSLLMLFTEGFGLEWLWVGIVGLLLLVTAIFTGPLNALRSSRHAVQGTGPIRFRFSEDCFSHECALESGLHPYRALHALWRFRGRYFLFLDRRHAYILPASGLSDGAPADFERFLSERTGLPWREPGRKAV